MAAEPPHLWELSSASTSMPNTPSSSPPLLALTSWELLLPHMPWVLSTLHDMQCTNCGHDWLTDGLPCHRFQCKPQLNTDTAAFAGKEQDVSENRSSNKPVPVMLQCSIPMHQTHTDSIVALGGAPPGCAGRPRRDLLPRAKRL